jgi:hypothetical protein
MIAHIEQGTDMLRGLTGSATGAIFCITALAGFQAKAEAPAPDATAAVASPAVMANFIAAGAIDPRGKVPALNAVAGAGVQNISLALPVSVLVHGRVYVYVLSSQNVTFKGTCTDSYTLSRGTVILDHKVIHTYDCGANTEWEWAAIGKAIPNSPGPATLTGTVTYGKLNVTATTKVLIK